MTSFLKVNFLVLYIGDVSNTMQHWGKAPSGRHFLNGFTSVGAVLRTQPLVVLADVAWANFSNQWVLQKPLVCVD